MADVLEELKSRCIAAGLRAELVEASIDPPVTRRLRVWYGEELEAERVIIRESIADFVAGTRFDAFRPLTEFEGIWSSSDGVIECELDEGGIGMPTRYRLATIARAMGVGDGTPVRFEDLPSFSISVPLEHDSIKASIRLASDEFTVLRSLFRPHMPVDIDRRPRRVVFRIEGFRANSADEAADLIERLSNSVLFQLDVNRSFAVLGQAQGPVRTGASAKCHEWRHVASWIRV